MVRIKCIFLLNISPTTGSIFILLFKYLLNAFQFKTIGLEAVSYVIDGRGVSEEMVDVDYDAEKYKMKEIPETRKMIETIWAERTKRNSRIFNQSKFRLAHHSWDSASLKLKMKVGITDYKDHVGTNLSPDVQKYLGTGDEKVTKTKIKF